MPNYEICYLDNLGHLTGELCAVCQDDKRAKILAHAMKLPDCKRFEVWKDEVRIYQRPLIDLG